MAGGRGPCSGPIVGEVVRKAGGPVMAKQVDVILASDTLVFGTCCPCGITVTHHAVFYPFFKCKGNTSLGKGEGRQSFIFAIQRFIFAMHVSFCNTIILLCVETHRRKN